MIGALTQINGSPLFHSRLRSNHSRPILCYRPILSVTMSNNNNNNNNQSYWTSLNNEIDAHLKRAIPIRPPLSVFEPMHDLTFAAPQTTSPALCIAACELVGGHRDQAMAAASTLRVLHAASFTHEHLPSVDSKRASTRPKISHAFGPNIELLTGDGMVPFGLELLALSDDPAQNDSVRILRAIIEITRAMGSQGVIQGQLNEVQYRQSNGEESIHVEWIDKICKKKEGEIHACAGACGAILGGGREEEIEKLRRYGLYVGTIQGILNLAKTKEKWPTKEVIHELRTLALKELKDFNQRKVEAISSLVDIHLCNL